MARTQNPSMTPLSIYRLYASDIRITVTPCNRSDESVAEFLNSVEGTLFGKSDALQVDSLFWTMNKFCPGHFDSDIFERVWLCGLVNNNFGWICGENSFNTRRNSPRRDKNKWYTLPSRHWQLWGTNLAIKEVKYSHSTWNVMRAHHPCCQKQWYYYLYIYTSWVYMYAPHTYMIYVHLDLYRYIYIHVYTYISICNICIYVCSMYTQIYMYKWWWLLCSLYFKSSNIYLVWYYTCVLI